MRAYVLLMVGFCLVVTPAVASAAPGDTLFTPDSLEGLAFGEDLDGTFTGRVAFGRVAWETFGWRSDAGFRTRVIGGFSVPLDKEPVSYAGGVLAFMGPDEEDGAEAKPPGPVGTISLFAVVSGTAWADRTAEGFDLGRVGLKFRLNGTDETWRAAVVHLTATFPVGAEQARDLHNVTTLLDLTLMDHEWPFGTDVALGAEVTVGRGIGRDPFTRFRARILVHILVFDVVLEQDLRIADSGADAGGFATVLRLPGDALFAEMRFRLVGPVGTAFSVSLGGRFW